MKLKYNRWTIIRDAGNKNGRSLCLCKCDCGKEKIVNKQNIKRGLSKSCGCYADEVRGKSSITHHEASVKRKTRTYRIWTGMKVRCQNKNCKMFPLYGGRGIKVCERWQKYENFIEDMGHCPEGLSLDRINNDGDYEKQNCRWADQITQANNARTNRWIFYDGKRQTMAQWGREIGVRPQLIAQRLDRDGWSVERVLTNDFQGLKNQHTLKIIKENTKEKQQ